MKYLLITLLVLTIFSLPLSVSAKVADYSSIAPGSTVFNVKTMGAKGDGIQNDTQVINDAISKTRSPNSGGVVYLPAGRYLVTGVNATFLSGATITGDGPDQTYIISAGFNGPVIDTLGSNYLTIAKLSIGLRDNATADAGIALGASAPHPNATAGASSTANSVDQVYIEDSGTSSSYNVASLLIVNSADNHITDSKFINYNRTNTPVTMITNDAQGSKLRSQYATVPDYIKDPQGGSGNPTDNTFINVINRKEKAGNTGAVVVKGGQIRYFGGSIDSADPSAVMLPDGILQWSGFYGTTITSIGSSRFNEACIKMISGVTIFGLTFDPPTCNSVVGPMGFDSNSQVYRLLYPASFFSERITPTSVPNFYQIEPAFPPAPAPIELSGTPPPSPLVSSTPSPSAAPSIAPSLSPIPSPTPCVNPSVDFGIWPSAGNNMLYQIYAVANGVENYLGYIGESQRVYVWKSGIVGNTYRFVVKWVAPDGRVGTHMTQDLKMFCP